MEKNNKQVRSISKVYKNSLYILMSILLLITIVMTLIIQNYFSNKSIIYSLQLHVNDTQADILDDSNAFLIHEASILANELQDKDPKDINQDLLINLKERYDVTEIDLVSKKGIIRLSTNNSHLWFNISNDSKYAEFLCLLDGLSTLYVQEFNKNLIDDIYPLKYVGVTINDGEFIHIGYDILKYQTRLNSAVYMVTENHHVGDAGGILIFDDQKNIVSTRKEKINEPIDKTFYDNKEPNKIFKATVYGEECYCLYNVKENYTIISYYPIKEAAKSARLIIILMILIEILGFTCLIFTVVRINNKLVVSNIRKVNHSLSKISDGDLNEVVNVNTNIEFKILSEGINQTVDSLKGYIEKEKTRMKQDLEFANIIQNSQLPKVFPNRDEIDLYALMKPAKIVGGDFYDFYFIDEDNLCITISDVSDKGIPAAMFMMSSKTLMHSNIMISNSLSEAIKNTNNTLCQNNQAAMFLTSWVGILNLRTGNLKYVNCGHNQPLVYHNGKFEYITTETDFILAAIDDMKYNEYNITLQENDILFLYTDGVTEANNEKLELFGEEHLHNILNNSEFNNSKELCHKMLKEITNYSSKVPQSDDITMVSLRFLKKDF